MAYGTQPFTDRNGDYKNPTIIDINKEYGKKKSYELPLVDEKQLTRSKDELKAYKEEQIKFILSTNPFHVATEYPHLILRENNKLNWDSQVVTELCNDDVFRYNLYTLLNKRVSLNV